ncbi:MAG: alternative ribosome rescue aminoacyl-tRNA hydrolase ArfB [Caldilineaceae bacterium]
MLEITPTLAIDESEISEEFVRASGPGGQNVNKVATAVQLRFNVQSSPSLPEAVRQRLIQLAGNRITEEGELLLEAKRYRSQLQNREDARQQLADLIRQATIRPKPRRKTKPTAAAQRKRLERKRQRSETKQQRRFRPDGS